MIHRRNQLNQPIINRFDDNDENDGEEQKEVIEANPNRLIQLLCIIVAISLAYLIVIKQRPSSYRTLKSINYIKYRHPLNSLIPDSIKPLKIFHITKEFGPATMGGLGVMLTALAIAQSDQSTEISIVLPHYSFLEQDYGRQIRPFRYMVVKVDGASNRRERLIGTKISLLKWNYTSAGDFLSPSSLPPQQRSIDIYLIGPGDSNPFNVAFKAKSSAEIYSSYKPLPQEWKDLWFTKTASQFIMTLKEEERDSVDVVHLHGATNAIIAYFLRLYQPTSPFSRRPISTPAKIPAIVYTIHDSLDEVEYTNLISNLIRFVDPPTHFPPFAPFHPHQLLYNISEFPPFVSPPALHALEPWIHYPRYSNPLPFFQADHRQLFTSALGIDLADQVTFVSRSIAKQIVEGEFRFQLEQLVLPSILYRATQGDFVGISNGIDFTVEDRNPFSSSRLIERGLAFPKIGHNFSSSFPTSITSPTSFVRSKRTAKEYLINSLPSLFSKDDLERPWLLFIGRFQYNKGCQFFDPLLSHLSTLPLSSSARLIVMGAQNNYPIHLLRSLSLAYPAHFTFIEQEDVQKEWGSMIRIASDLAFVPSFSEAFGLIAVEGLLFGMSIISSGVGGLMEFLTPIDSVGNGNSHLFELFPKEDNSTTKSYALAADKSRPSMIELAYGIVSCNSAAQTAIEAWYERKKDFELDEKCTRRLVGEALAMKYDRSNGPIDEYSLVYDRALKMNE